MSDTFAPPLPTPNCVFDNDDRELHLNQTGKESLEFANLCFSCSHAYVKPLLLPSPSDAAKPEVISCVLDRSIKLVLFRESADFPCKIVTRLSPEISIALCLLLICRFNSINPAQSHSNNRAVAVLSMSYGLRLSQMSSGFNLCSCSSKTTLSISFCRTKSINMQILTNNFGRTSIIRNFTSACIQP